MEVPGEAWARGRLEGRSEKAIDYCDQAIAADAGNGFAWSSKAYHLQLRGQFEEAMLALNKALEAQPDRDELPQVRDDLLLALGQTDELERQELAEMTSDSLQVGWRHRLWQ